MKNYIVLTMPEGCLLQDGNTLPERHAVYSDYGNALDALNYILDEEGIEAVEAKRTERSFSIALPGGYAELWIVNHEQR